MARLARVNKLKIKVCNFDDLDKVFEKVEEINKKLESSQYSGGVGVTVEVDLSCNHPTAP